MGKNTNTYAWVTTENANVIVEHSTDLAEYPYTIKKVNVWGVSDGTLSTDNPFSNDANYELVQQIDGANVYRKNTP